MGEYLHTANSAILWISAMPVALIVLFQAYAFTKKAKEASSLVDLSEEEARKAFRIGAFSAIGPALGVFLVMIGLMSVIGGPLAWMRLSIIGAAPTELAAATCAAEAQGIQLEDPNYNILNFANAAWVMALNGSAWLLTSGLFSDKLDKITQKVSGGSTKKMGILMISGMCGAFSFLFCNQLVNGATPYKAAAATSVIAMPLLNKIAKNHPKLREYNLGIAMVIGMIAGVIVENNITV